MQKKILGLLVGAIFLPAVSCAQVTTEDFAQIMQLAEEQGKVLNTNGLDTDIDSDSLSSDQQLKEAVKSLNLEDAVTIPIRNLKAILNDGEINYISDNGRYILKGELIDVWDYKILSNMSLIRNSVNRLNLSRLGKPITDLSTVSLFSKTTNAKEVVAFIGTQSQASKLLIKEARELTDKYTFHFVPVPAAGSQESLLIKKIVCRKDGQDALTAIEKNRVQKLEQKTSCDLSTLTETLVAADLMGVNGVPFIVAPNGVISRGLPKNLNDWIQENLI